MSKEELRRRVKEATTSTTANGQEDSDILAQLAALRAENEQLKALTVKHYNMSLKVSEKGGLSVYGLGRWPITLYKDQWKGLLDGAEKIRAFIEANEDRLSVKN